MYAVLLAVISKGADLDPERYWVAGVVYGLLFLIGLVVDLLLFILLMNRPPRMDRRMGRLLRRPFNVRDALALLAVLVALFSVGGSIAVVVTFSPGILLAFQSLLFHGLLVALFVLVLRRRGVSWARAFGVRFRRLSRHIAVGMVCYVGMLPVFLLCTVLYRLMLDTIGYEPALQPVAEVITGEPRIWLRIYLLFVGIVAAPVAEELVFRGIALPVLARRLGVVPAMVLVSLVFAGIHFHPEAVLPLFMVSLAFCAAYAATGSLVVPVVMHGLFNAVNLAVLFMVK